MQQSGRLHCNCLCLFQTSCLSDINYRSLLQKRGCLHCSSLHLLKISRLDGSSDRICYGALVAYLAAALFGACRNTYIFSVQYNSKHQVAYLSADCSGDCILCSNCSSPPSIWSLIQLQQSLIWQNTYRVPCLYVRSFK